MSSPPRSTNAAEVNFDGLVGPTHNYAGLSLGNRASMGNAGATSSPRRAALQGLAKMRSLIDLGVPQGILPPQIRPDPEILASLGFSGTVSLSEVADTQPALVPFLMSASPMWAANAATVSPSADTADGRVHFTPANLSSTTHRSFESRQTFHILRTIFASEERFCVHRPLPGAAAFADEGAANHGRFSAAHHKQGTHLFVYGRDAEDPVISTGFPRRQSRLAGELISTSHGLDPDRVIFARQSARAIDAGAFHNDVVSVVNQHVLFTHEHAFDQPEELYGQLGDALVVEVSESAVPLHDAISSYLFNSQLVTLANGTMMLIAPSNVLATESTAAYLDRAVTDPANPIAGVQTFDLQESMQNGGGPACLRLRVVLTDAEQEALSGKVLADDALLAQLEQWVREHYRDELSPADLTDPALARESSAALHELAAILELPRLYSL
ncbi:MAG: N-succinylarginine dihydrolase [Acidimicrobiales bacterium]|nr:N-succinylarginine dihydrolase [Acidimicrobiales bacterium]